MAKPELELTRARILSRARLDIVLDGLSAVHYGQGGGGWGGDAVEGWYICDTGSGDRLSMAWDREGLVALVFAHESDRSTYGQPVPADHPRTWLPELPKALRHLADTAASSLEGTTAGLWIHGDGEARLSDSVDADTRWADGAEMFVPLGMTAEDAVFGDFGQNWWELSSLSRAQAELALRLAEQSEGGPVALTGADAELVVANPDPEESPRVTHERAEEAREILLQVGIAWEIPTATIDAQLSAEDAARRARVEAAIGPEDRRILDAARSGDLDALRACLDAGADLETRTVEEQYEYTPAGDTPLIQALKKNHRGCAALLIERGARHDPANAFGQTALHWAVRAQDLEVTRSLLERGADAALAASDGWTALHWAAAEGLAEIVDLLLEHGADTSAVHRAGLTPAEVADRRGHADLAARLRARAS